MEKHLFNQYSQNEFILSKASEEDSVLVEKQASTDEQEDETPSYILGYNWAYRREEHHSYSNSDDSRGDIYYRRQYWLIGQH